jgi:hypothetical protein
LAKSWACVTQGPSGFTSSGVDDKEPKGRQVGGPLLHEKEEVRKQPASAALPHVRTA